jgi:hypothetical protein
MNKKFIFGFIGILFLFTMIFSGCKEEPEPVPLPVTYLVRGGGKAVGGGTFEQGVFVSPAGALIPYLIEDVRDTGTLSEVESLLRQLNFNQSWIQSVKNNLNAYKSAFVYYTNTSSYYRWIWITEN